MTQKQKQYDSKAFKNQLVWYNLWESILIIAVAISGWFVATNVFHADKETAALGTGFVASILSLIFAFFRASYSSRPLVIIEEALKHVSEEGSDVPAPDLNSEKLGGTYLASLVSDIYSLAVKSQPKPEVNPSTKIADAVLGQCALPVLAVDANQIVVYANTAAATYLEKPVADIIGGNINDRLHLWFSDEQTFEKWLNHTKATSITASSSWERVKLRFDDSRKEKLMDLVASYSRSNPSGFDTVLCLIDHSEKYGHDEQDIAYAAMAVHELRTPVTILRGYLEVLDDELKSVANEEQMRFIRNMNASAQQLSSFVSNILNIARIEENQLELHISEGSMSEIITKAVADLQLRAQVRNKVISLNITPDLPSIAVDKISILEVINNIVENAIKYSGDGKLIEVDVHAREGMIETTITDHGAGIPTANVSQIFGKFYRSHHTKSGVSGTGLGLYISKKIIDGHEGKIWFKTKEGEGSVFGFMLLPYQSYTANHAATRDLNEPKRVDGWIQNHSLYRR